MRCKHTTHEADTRVFPHRHPWAQLAYSSSGVMRVTAAQGTFMAPPSRAVWIPPGVEHAVTAVEHCHYHTLYLHQGQGRCGPAEVLVPSAARTCMPPNQAAALADETACEARCESAHQPERQPECQTEPPAEPPAERNWHSCQVLEVTELLRALILALDTRTDLAAPLTPAERLREQHLVAVLLDELSRARSVPLGLPMPRDKRLHQLCEAMLQEPARHTTLAAWAADAGASERTLARLFRAELNTSFARWRQQALMAHAMTLAARGLPMNHIASALGYASASAFSAMVRRELGAPPSQLFRVEPR